MKNRFIILLTFFVFFFMAWSCKKDFADKVENTPVTIEDLKVPADFDWKTTKDLSINFTAASSGIVELVNNEGIVYQKAYLQADATYTMTLDIPAYEKSLIAKFKYQTQPVALDTELISIRF